MSLLRDLSLKQRLLLVALLPAALLAIGVAALFLVRGTQAADKAMSERGIAIVSFLAPAAEYGVISGNRNSLAALLQAVLDQQGVAAAVVYDRAGEVLAVSGRPLLAQPERLGATAVARLLAQEHERLAVAAPVLSAPLTVEDVFNGTSRNTAEPVGWVHVELDTRSLANHKREIVYTTLGLLILVLGLTAVLARRLARSVATPVAQLVDAVDRMAAGELDVAVADTASSDELRALQRGFNHMAQAIAESRHTLEHRIEEATAQLAHQALHDPLTGLPNRRAFEQALEDAVAASRRSGDRGALCFIDLDRFKIVNDTCGHAAGDELLQRIAHLLRQRVRADDLLCRVGGDEFALILRGCSGEEAHRIAEGLREAVAAFRFSWEERRFSVGASIGMVLIDDGAAGTADLLVAADLACYAAKKRGRNRVVEQKHGLVNGRRSTDIAAVPFSVAEGIPYHSLSLYRQAIAPLSPQRGTLRWVEILLRLTDEFGGAHSPQNMLAQLEAGPAPLALDLWVAEQACRNIGALPVGAGERPLQFSLNVSHGSMLDAARYLDGLALNLQAHTIEPERVVLELPAGLAAQTPREAAVFAGQVHRLGCRLALERVDGGTVGLLQTLNPDYVKISVKALNDAYGLEAGYNLAQALCAAASVLSIAAVASEVEDPLFRDALPGYGFDYAQGQAIGAPEALS